MRGCTRPVPGHPPSFAQILGVSLVEVGTVLSLEKYAWSMLKRPRQQQKSHPPLPSRAWAPSPLDADARAEHRGQPEPKI